MPHAPRRVEVSPFPFGKRLAVTTSWDDGRVFDRRVVAAFNEWGLKGTFNLNSSRLGDGPPPRGDHPTASVATGEVASLYQGHEVGVHTVTHPWLDRLDGPQIACEVLDDRKALEDLVGYPVRGMAYPGNSYNQRVIDVIRSLGMVYARCGLVADRCFPAPEPLAWASNGHMYNTPDLLKKWQALCDNKKAIGQVFFIWGHSYEFETRNDWDGLERIFKPLAGHPEAWYCTNIQLFDYEAARNRVVIAANRKTAYNPSGTPVWLNVDGTQREVPPGGLVSLATP